MDYYYYFIIHSEKTCFRFIWFLRKKFFYKLQFNSFFMFVCFHSNTIFVKISHIFYVPSISMLLYLKFVIIPLDLDVYVYILHTFLHCQSYCWSGDGMMVVVMPPQATFQLRHREWRWCEEVKCVYHRTTKENIRPKIDEHRLISATIHLIIWKLTGTPLTG